MHKFSVVLQNQLVNLFIYFYDNEILDTPTVSQSHVCMFDREV